MHSAKISDQKTTKISKHQNDCAGDMVKREPMAQVQETLPSQGTPFIPPSSQGIFA